VHHTHTNLLGNDRDIGYGILRMSETQRWRLRDLGNPICATLLALLFQRGVAIHDLEVDRIEAKEIKSRGGRGAAGEVAAPADPLTRSRPARASSAGRCLTRERPSTGSRLLAAASVAPQRRVALIARGAHAVPLSKEEI
jgi:hypothetical protein